MSSARVSVTITIEKQVKNEWCWAAVSASVHKFFQGISQTQCQIATMVLKHRCCEPASSGECNHPQPLQPVLDSFGVLKPGDPLPRQLTFDEVRKEIDAGHPFCVLIKWLNNGQLGPAGHFVAINGYRVTPANKQFISIGDPLFSDFRVRLHRIHEHQGRVPRRSRGVDNDLSPGEASYLLMPLLFVKPPPEVWNTHGAALADLVGPHSPAVQFYHLPVGTLGLQQVGGGATLADAAPSGCRILCVL